jgi:hypothetical protein
MHRSWLHLPFELHALFADFKVAIIHDLCHDISPIAQFVIDKVWRAVAHQRAVVRLAVALTVAAVNHMVVAAENAASRWLL